MFLYINVDGDKMFEWLKNALFGPKRREFNELRDDCDQLLYRIKRIEGNMGIYIREQKKEADSEEMQIAIARGTALLKEGKSMQDIAQTLLTEHPTVALKLAKQFGIKL